MRESPNSHCWSTLQSTISGTSCQAMTLLFFPHSFIVYINIYISIYTYRLCFTACFVLSCDLEVWSKYPLGLCSVGETMQGAIRTKSKYQGCSLDDEDDWHQFRNGRVPCLLVCVVSFIFGCILSHIDCSIWSVIKAVRSTITETPTSSARQTPTTSVSSVR